MDFKTLSQRYDQGIATEAEKQEFERILEEYELIEGYRLDRLLIKYEDQMPDGLDEKLILPEEKKASEMKKIKRRIKGMMAKVVFISVISVVLLYFLVFFVARHVEDSFYYNPNQSTVSDGHHEDYFFDLTAYTEVNVPEVTIRSMTWAEPKGFGTYDLSYEIENLLTKETNIYKMKLQRGRLYTNGLVGIDSNENAIDIFYGFENIMFPKQYDDVSWDEESDPFIKDNNQRTLTALEQLNPLNYLSMTMTFDHDLSMEEFEALREANPNLRFKWVGVRTVEPGTTWNNNVSIRLLGFNPESGHDELSVGGIPSQEKYPIFYLNRIRESLKMSDFDTYSDYLARGDEIHFTSRLQYLVDREEFVNIFSSYGEFQSAYYKDVLAYIKDKGVKTYGVIVHGNVNDLNTLVENQPYKTIYINKALTLSPDYYTYNIEE